MIKKRTTGFTLIETMVAITLLMVAVIAPMQLTLQSLQSAYYARDEITASNLAQEGIESVIANVDGNIMEIAEGTGSPDLFQGITPGQWFTIDTHDDEDSFTSPPTPACASSAPAPDGAPNWEFLTGCPALQTDGELYGYSSSGWTNTPFTRSLYACYVGPSGCGISQTDEMRITVVVTWQTGSFQSQDVVLQENLYRWVNQSQQG